MKTKKQVLSENGTDAINANDDIDDHDGIDDGNDIAAVCWEGSVASVVGASSRGRGRGHARGHARGGQQRRQKRYKVTRRYYTSHRRFEQSLDIYEPLDDDDDDDDDDDGGGGSRQQDDSQQQQQQQQRRPHIVVLVMGSGWLGHRSFIYSGTNWWNSSAPRNIVSCGQVAICIRHSGGFPIVGTTFRAIVAFFIILWILYQQLLTSSSSSLKMAMMMEQQQQQQQKQIDWYNVIVDALTTLSSSWTFYVVFVLVTYIFLHVQSSYGLKRPATIQQMVDDVSKALSYIDGHIVTSSQISSSKMLLPKQQQQQDDNNNCSKNSNKTNNETKRKIPIIFGGYSSGGHVAATLLLSPTQSPLPKQKLRPPVTTPSTVVQQQKNIDSNDDGIIHNNIPSKLKNIEIEHVLLLSGVLDVSEEDDVMTLVCLTALNEWPENIPSPLKLLQQRLHVMTKQIQQQQDQQQQSENNSGKSSSSSSIYYPILPRHTLIGCKYEIPMGIPILRQSFCSTEYAKTLRNISQSNIHQCYLLEKGLSAFMPVNHWTILNSYELHETLRTKVFDDIDNDNDKNKNKDNNKVKES